MDEAAEFERFLEIFVPKVAEKSHQCCEAIWLLECTGSPEAAALTTRLRTEEDLLYADSGIYKQLLHWDQNASLKDPLLKRQLHLLVQAFKFTQIPKQLTEEIAAQESELSQSYGNFRPNFEGELISENAILEILKTEIDPTRRKSAWEASKQVGNHLAPQILNLVSLRNSKAQHLGYANYFQMKLDLQEVNEEWLFQTFENLICQSEPAYSAMIAEIEKVQADRFGVEKKELGPWSWSDPFSQSDPLDDGTLDRLVSDVDILASCERYFQKMGFNITPILARSDLFERPEKNQHAFCIHLDRLGDIRILANIKPSLNWLDGLLHELGHAVYELSIDEKLPWILRAPPSGIVTEAIALLMNRQAYRYHSLEELIQPTASKIPLMHKAEKSFKRRQLILSRFVVVLTFFERELYRNPTQDLNKLWWNLVHTYQKVPLPKGREGKQDWAAKLHIGLAPVYAFSYLLGELFASAIEASLAKDTKTHTLHSSVVGEWLKAKIFHLGNRLDWKQLIESATAQPLNAEAWVHQFCTL